MEKLGTVAWIVAAAIGVLIVVGVLRGWFRTKQEKPLISLVLLLHQPRQLDARVLAEAASRALGTKVTACEEASATDFVIGESPRFMLKVRGQMFLILNVAETYVKDVEATARSFRDGRLGRAVAEHKAWLAVDLLDDAPTTKAVEAAYRVIGKMIAELSGDDCLAIYAPQTKRMNTPAPEVLDGLRGPEPLRAVAKLADSPLIGIAEGDPRMKAAAEEARRRWPEFLAAFQQRKPGVHYSVKMPITRGGNTEFIWIEVTAIEGETIRGTLGNEPVNLPGLKLDSPVEAPLKDLNDWMYGDEKRVQGGFTMKVLAEAAGKKK